MKDYKRWCRKKAHLNSLIGKALFHKREVWWCVLGENIGNEQDGGEDFLRPVVIIKKFNLDSCLIVPLTARPKFGKYYLQIGQIGNRDAVAILSQIRFVDRKRLVNKITTLEKHLFKSLIEAILRSNFFV